MVPEKNKLDQLPTIAIGNQSQQGDDALTLAKANSKSFALGAGLSPVPAKIVVRIQAEEYADLSELLPEQLSGNADTSITLDSGEEKATHKKKRNRITSILEWAQCFSTYVAVLTKKHPQRISVLMG